MTHVIGTRAGLDSEVKQAAGCGTRAGCHNAIIRGRADWPSTCSSCASLLSMFKTWARSRRSVVAAEHAGSWTSLDYISVTREMSRAGQRLFDDFDSALTQRRPRHVGFALDAESAGLATVESVVEANAARSFSGQSIIASALHAGEHEVVTCPGRMSLCCRITVRRRIAHTIATRGGFTRHGLPCQKVTTRR